MILVTGASGQLASAILEHLSRLGGQAVGATRSVARSPGAYRAMDFDHPDTLTFVGVDTLVLVSAGTAEDDVVIQRHENAVAAAERDGVQHIVYTSLAQDADHLGFALAHRWTERRLEAGTVPWTVLRNGLYAELIGQLLAPRDGVITAPFGAGGVAAVARQDLSEAAAIIAQAPEKHRQRIYNLVGSTVITGQDVARQMGADYRPGTLAGLRNVLDSAGLLPFQPAMLISIHSAASHGFLECTDSDIAEILGRPPLDPLTVAVAAAQG